MLKYKTQDENLITIEIYALVTKSFVISAVEKVKQILKNRLRKCGLSISGSRLS
jgi:hypothetical protein